MLKTQYQSTILEDAATIFTIHNLTFQLAKGWWNVPSNKKDNGRNPIPGFYNKELQFTNYAKRGILYSDAINTVSAQYAQEIMTKKPILKLEKTTKGEVNDQESKFIKE